MSDWQIILAGLVTGLATWFWWDAWRYAKRNKPSAPTPSYREQAEAMAKANPQAIIAFSDAHPPTVIGQKPKPRKPRSDKGKPCTRLGPREKDITGQRFGLLVAVKRVRATKTGHPVWRFKCDCGNHYEALKSNIASPSSSTVSCGCWKKEHMKSVAAVGRAAKAAKRKEMH